MRKPCQRASLRTLAEVRACISTIYESAVAKFDGIREAYVFAPVVLAQIWLKEPDSERVRKPKRARARVLALKANRHTSLLSLSPGRGLRERR
jgi:hypothetical protein